ncbi:3D domain-containing protein [Rubritalea tangerina]|uniref:3D domain-containing protein n=1 Tax=Rubritalea tangerina TaxID=430798 RepID=A0ABW4ZBW6_9BACT
MSNLFFRTAMGLIASMAMTSCALDATTTTKVQKGMPHPPCPKLVAKDFGRQKDKHGMTTYKHDEHRRHVRTTSYSHMEKEKGCHGLKSAAGCQLKYTNKVRSAAADWSVYPMGTKFKIKGLPYVYEVNDYGSALVGTNTIDLFKPNLSTMRKWGTRKVEITVIEWGSYEQSRRILSGRTRYKHCRKMHSAIVKKLNTGQVAKLENS